MKNCENFQELTPLERVKMVGSIVHLLQVSNTVFNQVVNLIQIGEEVGCFEQVIIAPIEDFDDRREKDEESEETKLAEMYERERDTELYNR